MGLGSSTYPDLTDDVLTGELPRTVAELKSIPGIGDYTAGAIASIAFNVPAALVDGNVLRSDTCLVFNT
jgi:A/G-specific adenine glycosylase